MLRSTTLTRSTRAALALAATLAYGVAAAGAPVYSSRCSHHRATHGHESVASEHATPQADHAHPAPEEPQRGGPCTCLGICQGSAVFALPATGASRPLAYLDATPGARPEPNDFDLRPYPPFTLPYAHAPPLSV